MKMKKAGIMVLIMATLAMAVTGCGSDSGVAAAAEGGSDSGIAVTSEEGSDLGIVAAEEGEVSDTVAASDWDASMDITVISREDGSGTRGAFIELMGVEQKDESGEKIDYTTTDAQITNSTSVMMTSVAGDEYAIGYVSLGSLNDSVKALKIDGAEATAENVKAGTYQVSRPFNIVIKEGASNEVATDFQNFILSTEGQKVVQEENYIPLDNTQAFETTAPAGKCVVGGSSSVSPVMEKLMEAYKQLNPNAEIELQTTDSTTGVTSTLDGSYDIGMASRELKEEETGVTATVIATDGIAVVVNNACPIDELTTQQVKAIYTGQVLTWDEAAE